MILYLDLDFAKFTNFTHRSVYFCLEEDGIYTFDANNKDCVGPKQNACANSGDFDVEILWGADLSHLQARETRVKGLKFSRWLPQLDK